MVNGITYKNKHSYKDYGITIRERSIGYPQANYVITTIPYANGYFDFTEAFGGVPYQDREIKYSLNIISKTLAELQNKCVELANWLKGNKQDKLYDDTIKGFYFKAQVKSWELKTLSSKYGQLDVTFLCYPLKIRDAIEGDIKWDDFIFTTDTLQQTKFTISNEEKEIELINKSSIKINPCVNCDTDTVSIILEDKTEIKINKSNSSNRYYYLFELEQGLNRFKIKGTGTIEFIIRNEVL